MGNNISVTNSLRTLRIKRFRRTARDRFVLSHSCSGGTERHKRLSISTSVLIRLPILAERTPIAFRQQLPMLLGDQLSLIVEPHTYTFCSKQIIMCTYGEKDICHLAWHLVSCGLVPTWSERASLKNNA